jgi:hypothetical protein
LFDLTLTLTQTAREWRRMAMTNWDYLTLSIHYDKKEHKNWVVTYQERPPLVGLQAILAAHGSAGWELVSLDSERMEAYTGFGKYTIEPITYRATFKRPRED